MISIDDHHVSAPPTRRDSSGGAHSPSLSQIVSEKRENFCLGTPQHIRGEIWANMLETSRGRRVFASRRERHHFESQPLSQPKFRNDLETRCSKRVLNPTGSHSLRAAIGGRGCTRHAPRLDALYFVWSSRRRAGEPKNAKAIGEVHVR